MDILGAIGDFFGGLFNSLIDWGLGLINGLLEGLGSLLTWWFDSLGLSISVPLGVFNVLNDITYSIGYIFPIKELLPIPLFMLSFYVAKIVFAVFQIIASTVIKRVKIKL